jgi:hypothetical protein
MRASHARSGAERIALNQTGNHADLFFLAQFIHADNILDRSSISNKKIHFEQFVFGRNYPTPLFSARLAERRKVLEDVLARLAGLAAQIFWCLASKNHGHILLENAANWPKTGLEFYQFPTLYFRYLFVFKPIRFL